MSATPIATNSSYLVSKQWWLFLCRKEDSAIPIKVKSNTWVGSEQGEEEKHPQHPFYSNKTPLYKWTPCFYDAAFLAFLTPVFLSKAVEATVLFPTFKNLIAFMFSVSLSAECPRRSPLWPDHIKHLSSVTQEGIKVISPMLFSSLDKMSSGKPRGAKQHPRVSTGLLIAHMP